MAEQCFRKAEVGGSTPLSGSKIRFSDYCVVTLIIPTSTSRTRSIKDIFPMKHIMKHSAATMLIVVSSKIIRALAF